MSKTKLIKWIIIEAYLEQDRHYSISECGNYKIINTGERKGDRYCLLSKKGKYKDYGCFCVQLSMGTYSEVKEKANEKARVVSNQ